MTIKPNGSGPPRERVRDFLAGLLELLSDDLERARTAARLIAPGDLPPASPEQDLLLAVLEVLALPAPRPADVMDAIRERAGDLPADGRDPAADLLADLMAAAADNRAGYSAGIERHAAAIVRDAAAARRRREATALAAVASDPNAEPEEIEAHAAAVVAAAAAEPAERLEWEPLPVELLPEPLAAFVTQAAAALPADPAFVALPLLAAIAAAIGNSRVIQPRPGWREPAILWAAVVAGSGSGKSPGARKALEFVRQREGAAMANYRERESEYQRARIMHEEELAAWKRTAKRGQGTEPPDPPERPTAERLVISDTTIEALAVILEQNPNGVLLARDELAGWLASMDQYKAGGRGGADVAHWLSIYNGEPMTMDRKGSGVVYVPTASVSVFGGIQPAAAARLFLGANVENGLLPRFILASPPKQRKAWGVRDVDGGTLLAMRGLFDGLWLLEPGSDGGPVVLALDADAEAAFAAFYDELAEEQLAATGAVESMLAKSEAWAARLALVCHVARQHGQEPRLPDRIDAESIRRGVGLARWAAREWRRVFRGLERGSLEADDRGLREWILARGGSASVRDVQRGLRRYQRPGAAEDGLRRLVKGGAAEWESGASGGRPADAVRVRG